MHPAAVKALKDVVEQLAHGQPGEVDKIANWVCAKI
jgi:CO dehydrogenase/acetyl-CoA synthase delta subunit